jgi:hypothetical protein
MKKSLVSSETHKSMVSASGEPQTRWPCPECGKTKHLCGDGQCTPPSEPLKVPLQYLYRWTTSGMEAGRDQENGWVPACVLPADTFTRSSSALPVATILNSDPYDEREGLWFSAADLAKLRALPAGTKLYAAPVSAMAEPSEREIELEDALRTLLEWPVLSDAKNYGDRKEVKRARSALARGKP